MSPIKEQLTNVIDCLQEADLLLLLEIAKRFVEDDVATPEDLQAHQAAMEEYARGETVSHSDIDWD